MGDVAVVAPPSRADPIVSYPDRREAITAPPPLCAPLVLPSEIILTIPVEKLMEGLGSFPICGSDRAPLLRATVKASGNGGGVGAGGLPQRTIEIALPASRSPAIASIGAPLYPMEAEALEVRGNLYSHYGWLRPSRGGSYSLTCNGVEALSIVGEHEGYRVYSPGRSSAFPAEPMAHAARSETVPDHLEIKVCAHVDAVLVLTCVLAVVLFGGGPSPAREVRKDN